MEKKLIKVEIFHKIDYDKPIPFSKIKNIGLEDNDIINSGWNEGFYTENNSMDDHYYMSITRERLETDEEFEKRKHKSELDSKWSKERRYASYLKLKEEFGDVEETS